jgi:hypothetical protein
VVDFSFAKVSGSILLKVMARECAEVLRQLDACYIGNIQTDPLLSALMELRVKLSWCLFSYDGLVQLPQAKRHLICFPFELSVYIT